MAILCCLETSSARCSIAISENERLIHLVEEGNEYQHIEVISIHFKHILKKSGLSIRDLDAIAVSAGPGSFTGLRVGASFAKGVCFSSGIPLIGVDTLESVALASTESYQKDEDPVYCAMIKARPGEVYCCIYSSSWEKLIPNQVIDLRGNHFLENYFVEHLVIFSGGGSEEYRRLKGKNKRYLFTDIVPSAAHLINPAYREYGKMNFSNVVYFTPGYLKPPNITKSRKLM